MITPLGPGLTFVYTGMAVLLAGVCYGCRFVQRPNRWYGVTTKWALGDERVWHEVNARFARTGATVGLVLAALFALVGLWQATARAAGRVNLGIAVAEAALLVAAMLVLALVALSDSRRTWRRYHQEEK